MQWFPGAWVDESRQFYMEGRAEFRKITWPSQKEATAGTIGVFVVVVVVTTVLSLFDLVLGQVIQLVIP
jgi:preprotein translocase SecE subunit